MKRNNIDKYNYNIFIATNMVAFAISARFPSIYDKQPVSKNILCDFRVNRKSPKEFLKFIKGNLV